MGLGFRVQGVGYLGQESIQGFRASSPPPYITPLPPPRPPNINTPVMNYIRGDLNVTV